MSCSEAEEVSDAEQIDQRLLWKSCDRLTSSEGIVCWTMEAVRGERDELSEGRAKRRAGTLASMRDSVAGPQHSS